MRLIPLIAIGVVIVAGCGDDSADGTDADPRTEGRPSVSATAEDRPVGGKTPEETLRMLVKLIADEDGEGACGLFLPGGASVFAKNFEAPTCEAAMDIVIGAVTDPENFGKAELKPSGTWPGVVTKGDLAGFGGNCTGWTGEPEVRSGFEPSGLGYITMKRTDDGWLINGNRLPNDSCGG